MKKKVIFLLALFFIFGLGFFVFFQNYNEDVEQKKRIIENLCSGEGQTCRESCTPEEVPLFFCGKDRVCCTTEGHLHLE